MDRATGKRTLIHSKVCCDHNAAAAHVCHQGQLDIFPAGVRFDPSDEELLEHLAEQIGRGSKPPHPLLHQFIRTLEEEDGICRTHPENLPGVRKDGSSCHYFHKPSMAYTTGTRKRRKIQTDDVPDGGPDVRWHKTGKTRPVTQNGKVLGHKKIMVLYRATGKKSKNLKTNWVMHQYHLGGNEEETDGELVVCKVFFQKAPRSCPSRKPGAAAADEEECEPSESDIGFQEPTAGLSGDSPSASVVTRGLPLPTPKAYTGSRTAKQLYAEPTESISEIFDPSALATQSKQKQKAAFVRIDKERVGVDMNQVPAGYETQALGAGLGIPLYGEKQVAHTNGGSGGHISCEGEAESYHTVNLNDEHESWRHVEDDPYVMLDDPALTELLCDEHLNGDPLAEDEDYQGVNFRNLSYDVGCSMEDEPFGGDTNAEGNPISTLDGIDLDTPPEMMSTPPLLDTPLEYPVVTSQEVRDWCDKNRVVDLDNTDSQSTT